MSVIAGRILLVDDDTDTLDVLRRILSLSGFVVQVANGAMQAKELCGEQSFDIMVSDIGLPDQTGHELMREIKRLYGIPGIALSGYSSNEDINESREAGFDHHVVKPIQSDRLVEVIHLVLSGRATRQRHRDPAD